MQAFGGRFTAQLVNSFGAPLTAAIVHGMSASLTSRLVRTREGMMGHVSVCFLMEESAVRNCCTMKTLLEQSLCCLLERQVTSFGPHLTSDIVGAIGPDMTSRLVQVLVRLT